MSQYLVCCKIITNHKSNVITFVIAHVQNIFLVMGTIGSILVTISISQYRIINDSHHAITLHPEACCL